MEELRKTLETLNVKIISGGVLKVRKTITMERLAVTLEKEDYVTVKENGSELILKPTSHAIAFYPVYRLTEVIGRQNTNISRREIPEVASKLLPSVTGTMLLTTTTGIMTHHRAILENTGGSIIGIAY